MMSIATHPESEIRLKEQAGIARDRNQEVDSFRFIASVGVVWDHASSAAVIPGLGHPEVLGAFCVPFFTVAALYFTTLAVARGQPSFESFAVSRFNRLYRPFLAWSAIYWILKICLAGKREPIGLNFLWEGGAYHLWYLPFLLTACLLCYPIARIGLHRRARAASLAIVCLMAAIVMVLSERWFKSLVCIPISMRHVFRIWVAATPAAFCGIALAALELAGMSWRRYRRGLKTDCRVVRAVG